MLVDDRFEYAAKLAPWCKELNKFGMRVVIDCEIKVIVSQHFWISFLVPLCRRDKGENK